MLASPTRNNIRSEMMSKMRGVEIFTGIHATVSPGSYYTIDGKSLLFTASADDDFYSSDIFYYFDIKANLKRQ